MSLIAAGATRNDNTLLRTLVWTALCVFEVLTISMVHELPLAIPNLHNPFFYLRSVALWALCSVLAFVLIAWPQRREILGFRALVQGGDDWRLPLLANLALFGSVIALDLTVFATPGVVPSPALLAVYAALIAATALSLVRLDLPFGAVCEILSRYRWSFAAALAAGLAAQLLSLAAQDQWSTLAGATLYVVRAVLEIYEPHVVVDTVERTVRVGDFKVRIWESCSGYEGVALVCVFLTVYLWVFRRTLQFPRALLLFPIGIVSVWLLNALRIVALTSIGAHWSPQVAAQGFHSQAGWIAFLIVAFATMVLAHRSTYFTGAVPVRREASGDRIVLAYLVPFIVLMLTSILMAAAAPNDKPLYAVKVAAVTLVLWYFADVYAKLRWVVSGEAVLAGLAVGAVWIATQPQTDGGTELAGWLAQLSLPAAAAWLAVRFFGTAVLVPVAEELAFRGFLYRWFISAKFEAVSFGARSVIGLVASSLLFGLLHDRWLAAALSGVVFAVLMWRSQRLSDAIAAHAVANAVIFLWAVAFQQWSLL